MRLDDVNPYIEDGLTHNNASKYLLYNDPLIGTFDSVVQKDTVEKIWKNSRASWRTAEGKSVFLLDGNSQKFVPCVGEKSRSWKGNPIGV